VQVHWQACGRGLETFLGDLGEPETHRDRSLRRLVQPRRHRESLRLLVQPLAIYRGDIRSHALRRGQPIRDQEVTDTLPVYIGEREDGHLFGGTKPTNAELDLPDLSQGPVHAQPPNAAGEEGEIAVPVRRTAILESPVGASAC